MILIRVERVLESAERLDLKADAVLDGDRIAGVFPANRGGAEGAPDFNPWERTHRQTIEAEGLVAVPGLVDVHVHSRDPGPTYKEDTHTGARAAVKGDFTTVVYMTNMNLIVDNEKTLRYMLEEGKKTGIHVLSYAVVSRGFAGRELTDMKGLLAAGTAGFTDDGILLTDGVFVRVAMEEAVRLGTALSFHGEDKRFIRENGISHDRISDELGVYSSPALAEDSLMARDCMIVLDTETTVDIQHISSGHSVEVVRLVKRLGAKVWAGATPHHFTLTEKAALKHGTLVETNPPLRAEKDRQMLIEGLKGGTINIIATDHTLHSREGKEWPLIQAPSGILGLETVLTLRITNLIKAGHLALLELMEKMSLNPARLYKLDCGHMELGTPVDLMLFDAGRQWTVEGFGSKSASSPFLGETLTGEVVYTACGGEVVYGEQGTKV